MADRLKILSLGAGVQSSVVLLMSCRGELPRLDAAIFADTGWEPGAVYSNLEFLKIKALQAKIPLHVVRAGDIRKDLATSQIRGRQENGGRWVSMPLRTLNPDGSNGMIRRQCTREYKIDPIHKKVREMLGKSKGQHIRGGEIRVDQWFGIGIDEADRMNVSDVKWIENVYPLIDMLDPRFGRPACFQWLAEHYPGRVFPRSACVGCPYRSDQDWKNLKPEEFDDAVAADELVRNMGGMRGEAFLHRSCTPLKTVDLGRDQGELFGEECAGYCGV